MSSVEVIYSDQEMVHNDAPLCSGEKTSCSRAYSHANGFGNYNNAPAKEEYSENYNNVQNVPRANIPASTAHTSGGGEGAPRYWLGRYIPPPCPKATHPPQKSWYDRICEDPSLYKPSPLSITERVQALPRPTLPPEPEPKPDFLKKYFRPIRKMHFRSLNELDKNSYLLRRNIIPCARQTQREIEQNFYPLPPAQSIVLRHLQQEISSLYDILSKRNLMPSNKEEVISPKYLPALREIPQNILNLVKQSAYNPEIANQLQPIAQEIKDQVEKTIKSYNNVRRSLLAGTHRERSRAMLSTN